MLPEAPLIAFGAFLATVKAQSACTLTAETHPSLTWSQCTSGGTCTTKTGSVTLDSNWRWLHTVSGSTNCYTGNEWNTSICSSAATCASACCLDGADYSGTYGVTSSGNELSLKFVTVGQYSTNIGSRLYLMASDTAYQGFTLLGNEFTFDVDVSDLDCGLNGAVYFVAMDLDGGTSKYSTNTAGPKYGTGYCDSQCPRDLKFIAGQANVEGWVSSSNDANSGVGDLGACCSEMDIWESNKISTAYTPHPCSTVGYHTCDADNCGGTYSSSRYAGDCDPDGCDFNSYRQGNTTFFGPGSGFTIDSTTPVTVVTQFITGDDGVLSDIKRFYVQNGVTIGNSESLIAGTGENSITEDYCVAQKAAFGDNTGFISKGGLAQMSKALAEPMVLVMSLWDDHYADMLWLDSDYPTTASTSTPGVARGTCSTSSGVPSDVESSQASATVKYSNIKFGPIGSTFSGGTGTGTGTTTIATSATGTAASTSVATGSVSSSAYGFAKGATGGGSATPAAPSDIAELKSWLSDDTPRVILIDKTFNYVGTEGTATSSGCYQSSCPLTSGGQDYIGTLSCGNSNDISVSITYDVAGTNQLIVASDKTILGVGSSGVIQGKGLQLPSGTNNVIIQNIHITDINPGHVWGGDALDLRGNNLVWIDHNKFSLVGRQFIVSHYDASFFTISNNEFDGVTTTSATCNGDHYWTNMFIADGSHITIDGNYYHDVSGRAPKLGEDGVSMIVQASNNYFSNMLGHAFDIYTGTSVLIEGNVFSSVTTPIASYTGTIFDVPAAGNEATCSQYLSRSCQINSLSSSGTLYSLTNTGALSALQLYVSTGNIVTPIAASGVAAKVTANAGVGLV